MKLSRVYKAKTYKEAEDKCPKGYRIPEIWELVELVCKKNKKVMKPKKYPFIFFWSKTKYDKHIQRVLFQDTDIYLGTRSKDLPQLYSICYVFYIKEEE